MTRAALLAALLALSATPAAAIDCARAVTPAEKAICASPQALEADDALGRAFAALQKSLVQEQRAMLVKAQARWLMDRDGGCSESKVAALGDCLATATRERTAYMTGAPEAGPGATAKLIPHIFIQASDSSHADVNHQLLRFAAPASAGERAFNAEIDKMGADVANPSKGDANPETYFDNWSMHLAYASPALISVHAEGDSFAGGAHPNRYSRSMTLDMHAGKLLRFADLLDHAGAAKVAAFCVDEVVKQQKEKSADLTAADNVDLLKNVTQANADLARWTFGAKEALIAYDPYAVGSYAEGAYDCTLPYTKLRPLATPTFPLP